MMRTIKQNCAPTPMKKHLTPRRYPIFGPLVGFVVIAASLVFFLPVAISMNTQGTLPRGAESSALSIFPSTGQQDHLQYRAPFMAEKTDLSAKSKKGSLSLKTAAMVGSSPTNAALQLFVDRDASSIENSR
jgi:hypothetical protein